jgi:prevent-host-death family protein
MASWAVAEAKAKFSAVVAQAQTKGPQQITKGGKPVAVVISIEEWRAEHGTDKPKETLADFFRNSPLRGSGIKIGRVRLDPRHIEF